MQSYNVAEAKSHLSEILERVAEGEEVLLTRRGKPLARLVPASRTGGNILGSGREDPNINFEALASDAWWQAAFDEETTPWYE